MSEIELPEGIWGQGPIVRGNVIDETLHGGN